MMTIHTFNFHLDRNVEMGWWIMDLAVYLHLATSPHPHHKQYCPWPGNGGKYRLACRIQCKIPKQLTQCRNISEWRRCFILLVSLRRKGIILSVSLNGAMAEMPNQLKSHLESGVTTPRLHQVKTGQKRSQLTLYYSLKSYGCSKNTKIFSFYLTFYIY